VNSLHGGPGGFHNVFWEVAETDVQNSLLLHYLSKDGEEGYPGNLDVEVIYTLTNDNELVIDYLATTDKTTVVNLTHHSFFNLAGDGAGDVLNHQIMISSDRFTPVDQDLIPTGEFRKVEGTAFDFRKPHSIGERIGANDEQLRAGKGYDHNWVLNKKGDSLSLAARVVEPVSGRVMEVWTTEPGLQFYSGNFLNGKDIGKGGKPYPFRGAFCLEAQHFPDSPNHPEFPSLVLKPGERYEQRTVYKFSSRNN
jgi:aldose 1-epimerase